MLIKHVLEDCRIQLKNKHDFEIIPSVFVTYLRAVFKFHTERFLMHKRTCVDVKNLDLFHDRIKSVLLK